MKLLKQHRETAAAHPDASIGASEVPPHEGGTRLSISKPRLNTYALYPRCKHLGIRIKKKFLDRKIINAILIYLLLFVFISITATAQNIAWNPNPNPNSIGGIPSIDQYDPGAQFDPTEDQDSQSSSSISWPDMDDQIGEIEDQLSQSSSSMPGLPNPAYDYCLQQGGKIRKEFDGKSYCDLPDGSTCELEALYSGECGRRQESEIKNQRQTECSGEVSGHVYDAVTNEPISSAAIDGGNLCNLACPTTNSEGFYTFSQLQSFACPYTTYTLSCGAEGYISATNTVVTDASGNAVSDFHLNPNSKGNKLFKIWVGDRNSINLPGAEVFVDGASKGMTDSNGEVRTEVTFGQHAGLGQGRLR